MGFGVPVIKYRNGMYYSKDAMMIRINKKNVVGKNFRMDSLERIRIGKLGKIEFPSPALRFLAFAYRSSNFLGKRMTQVDQALRKRAEIETEFVAVKNRGDVSMTYEINSHRIHVKCDLTRLEKDALQKIFILNEQGSCFFRQYSDTDGVHLARGEIGAWKRVKAERACFSDPKSTFAFCLNGLEGIAMWRGREDHADLRWSGLIYESGPNTDIIDYDILLRY